VAMGGLPTRRATVVAGQAGSAKSVFAGQFLAEGVRRGEPGVFVTLEEPAADLRANLATLGFDVAGWEAAGDWRFVDASPLSTAEGVAPYDLDTLAAQIGHAVDATGAHRLVLDSVNAVLALQDDATASRQVLRSIIASLRALGLTIIITVETSSDPSTSVSSFGVEEFVADSVLLLHNIREGRVRRRTVEILKMRGAMHLKGEAAFTVRPGRGVVVLPSLRRERQSFSDERMTSGNTGLDTMLDGGLYEGSITLVAGPAGAGKTLTATAFLAAAVDAGERALLLAYEESGDEVVRNASGWGKDFRTYQERGLLRMSTLSPDAGSLDEHLVEIQDLVRAFRPARVAVDSISALERLGTGESYREFATRLTDFLKQEGISSIITLSSAGLPNDAAPAESHIAALTDAVILLRLAESGGELRRTVTVLKLRGSAHDQRIRSFTIAGDGMHVGGPYDGAGTGLPPP
ncbi:MAG: circadian clock protein KaiC, partial [Actinotalea sp.]|nr:circadian clock protein KaiC [Actinotalea sp.]